MYIIEVKLFTATLFWELTFGSYLHYTNKLAVKNF